MSSPDDALRAIQNFLYEDGLLSKNEVKRGRLSSCLPVILFYLCSSLGKHHLLDLLCDLIAQSGLVKDEKRILLQAVHGAIHNGYIGCALLLLKICPDTAFIRLNKLTAIDLFLSQMPVYEVAFECYKENAVFVWGNNRNFILGLDDDCDWKVPKRFPSDLPYERLYLTYFTGVFWSKSSPPCVTITGKTPWGTSAVRPFHLSLTTDQKSAGISQVAFVTDRKGGNGHLVIMDGMNIPWCLANIDNVATNAVAWSGGPLVDSVFGGTASGVLPNRFAWFKLSLPKSMPPLRGIGAGENYIVFYSDEDVYACGINRGQFGSRKLIMDDENCLRQVQYITSVGMRGGGDQQKTSIVSVECGSHAILILCRHQSPHMEGTYLTDSYCTVELLHNNTRRLLLPRCRDVYQMRIIDSPDGDTSTGNKISSNTARSLILYTTAQLKKVLSIWNAWDNCPPVIHIRCEHEGVPLIPERFAASPSSLVFCTSNGLVFTASKNWCSLKNLVHSEGVSPFYEEESIVEGQEAWRLTGVMKALTAAPTLVISVNRRKHLFHVHNVASDPYGHSFVALSHISHPTIRQDDQCSIPNKSEKPFTNIFLQDPADLIVTCKTTAVEFPSHRFVWALQCPAMAKLIQHRHDAQNSIETPNWQHVLPDAMVLYKEDDVSHLKFPTLSDVEVMSVMRVLYGVPAEDKNEVSKPTKKSQRIINQLLFSNVKSPSSHSSLSFVDRLESYSPDVVLLCSDGSTLSAHKIILSSSSAVWESQLSGRWNETDERNMLDCAYTHVVISCLVSFLYTHTNENWPIPSSSDWLFLLDLCGYVLEAADYYLVNCMFLLKNECSRLILQQRISRDNIARIVSFAVGWDLSYLAEVCCDRILCHLSFYLDNNNLNPLTWYALEELSRRYRQVVLQAEDEEVDHLIILSSSLDFLRNLLRSKDSSRHSISSVASNKSSSEESLMQLLDKLETDLVIQREILLNSESILPSSNVTGNLEEYGEQDMELEGKVLDGGRMRQISLGSNTEAGSRKRKQRNVRLRSRNVREWRHGLQEVSNIPTSPIEKSEPLAPNNISSVDIQLEETQPPVTSSALETSNKTAEFSSTVEAGSVKSFSLKEIMNMEIDSSEKATAVKHDKVSVSEKRKIHFSKPSQRERKTQLQQKKASENETTVANTSSPTSNKPAPSVAPWAPSVAASSTRTAKDDRPVMTSSPVTSKKRPLSFKEIMLSEENENQRNKEIPSFTSSSGKSRSFSESCKSSTVTNDMTSPRQITRKNSERVENLIEDVDKFPKTLRFVTFTQSSARRQQEMRENSILTASTSEELPSRVENPWPASTKTPHSHDSSSFKIIQQEQHVLESITRGVKSLELIQIEERALAELQEYYKISTTFDMNIRVQLLHSSNSSAEAHVFPLKWKR